MNKNQKGVLILTPFFSPNIGGVETHLDNLVSNLDEKGYRIFVQTYSPLTTENTSWKKNELLGNNIQINRYRWFGKNLFHTLERYPILDFLYLTPYLFIRSLLFMITNSKKIDVIHAQGLNAGAIGVILKAIFKKRLIISLHAIYTNIDNHGLIAFLIQMILNSAHVALGMSKAVNDQATQMQQTIITNPQLRITLMDTAELLEANASKPKIMPIDDLKTAGNVTIIGLKDIIRNEPHALHFKIKVTAGEGENIPFLTAEILEGSNVVAGPDTIEISYTNDRKLYNIENKNIFWSFLGTEATILNGKTLEGDSDAGKRADTIMNTLESSKTLEEGTLAHDTVAHAEKIHGKIVPDLTASEKKKLLHSTTVMEDTMTEKLDEAINDLKNSEEDEKE